jgi:hypothetical protein
MKSLTSNQLYGGLNRRFEKRAALLRKAGFRYCIIVPGVAGFVHKNAMSREHFPTKWGKSVIPAATVHHAKTECFWDAVKSAVTRV